MSWADVGVDDADVAGVGGRHVLLEGAVLAKAGQQRVFGRPVDE